MSLANWKRRIIFVAVSLLPLESFAQEIIRKPWTSKYSQSSISSCGDSELLVGLDIKHPQGQNLTYQESFRALCAKSKTRLQAAGNTGLVKKGKLHSRRSCEQSFANSVLFHHANGQNLTYQESFGMHCKKPLRPLKACYFTPWQNKFRLQENFQCRAGDAVMAIEMKHPNNQNWTYQESIRLQCCKAQLRNPAPTPPGQRTIADKIADRTFPSVFQAWNKADNLPNEDPLDTLARHDLVFHAPKFFKLQWTDYWPGLGTKFTAASIAAAKKRIAEIRQRNPNVLLIAEIRYRDAGDNWFRSDHPWWMFDGSGNRIPGWDEGNHFMLNYKHHEFRAHVAARAKAASELLDGVMLDWWDDDNDRLDLVKRVRAAVGPNKIVMANANSRKTPRTAPYLNGYFMEVSRTTSNADWIQAQDTLVWAESNLRAPRVNCLETWYHNSRQDLDLMRATTTLSLTASNGYALFSDPNSLKAPDHLHSWYPFWNKSLGKALTPGKPLYPGATARHRVFENGIVVYNPPNSILVNIDFNPPQGLFRSLRTGRIARHHEIPPKDGDILLRMP